MVRFKKQRDLETLKNFVLEDWKTVDEDSKEEIPLTGSAL